MTSDTIKRAQTGLRTHIGNVVMLHMFGNKKDDKVINKNENKLGLSCAKLRLKLGCLLGLS